MLDAEGRAIKARIEAELAASSDTHAAWPGFTEEAKYRELTGAWATYRRDASALVKGAANNVGRVAGCHTCLSFAHLDNDQAWIGDHCPPTELPQVAREMLGCRTQTYLFPQCGPCSQQQSGLVSMLSRKKSGELRAAVAELTDDQKKLLTGTKAPVDSGTGQNCVISHSPSVSDLQGVAIQALGGGVKNQGCHTCGTQYPQPNYVADHVVPKAFVTEGMRQLFIKLSIPLPDLLFRPQCNRCSTGQGGAVSAVVTRAREYGITLGIVFTETLC